MTVTDSFIASTVSGEYNASACRKTIRADALHQVDLTAGKEYVKFNYLYSLKNGSSLLYTRHISPMEVCLPISDEYVVYSL